MSNTIVKVDITREAMWVVSSNKINHEVCNLLDDSNETYWQSDGPLPHIITAYFNELQLLYDMKIYIDGEIDESYTPLDVVVRVGLIRADLMEIHAIEIDNPKGWITFSLQDIDESPIPAHVLQLQITTNHQEGRDSRIRKIRIRAFKS